MKKKVFVFILPVIFLFVVVAVLFSGGETDYSDYKNVKGYKEYVTETDSGYKNAPYYFCDEPMLTNKDALHYYKNNCRQVGDYYITNYLDGVCINRFVESENCKDIDELGHLTVPKEIDGLPVLKIGCYVEDDIFTPEIEILPAFDPYTLSVTLPASVKYISSSAIFSLANNVVENTTYIDFDKDNPYYVSVKGDIYTKNMETLLYLYKPYYIPDDFLNTLPDDVRASIEEPIFKIPEMVNYFYPSNGIDYYHTKHLEFHKNIQDIKADISYATNLEEQIPSDDPEDNLYQHQLTVYKVYGYRDTVAEKWARDICFKFYPLD